MTELNWKKIGEAKKIRKYQQTLNVPWAKKLHPISKDLEDLFSQAEEGSGKIGWHYQFILSVKAQAAKKGHISLKQKKLLQQIALFKK